jgi:hypothetical protein
MRETTKHGGFYFIAAALGLTAGALLHVVALVGGPEWIAFVGAPASVVESAKTGTWLAPVGALGITALLLVLALYCLSAAGKIRPFPFRSSVLAVVAAIFVIRGLIIIPWLVSGRVKWSVLLDLFIVSSSLTIFAIGAALICGLIHSKGRNANSLKQGLS